MTLAFEAFQWVYVIASVDDPYLIGRGGQISHRDDEGCFVMFVEGTTAWFAHPDQELALAPERDVPVLRLLMTYYLMAGKAKQRMSLRTLSQTLDDLGSLIRAGRELITALLADRTADRAQIERLRAYAVSARARLDLEGVRGDDGDDAERLLHPGDLPPFEYK